MFVFWVGLFSVLGLGRWRMDGFFDDVHMVYNLFKHQPPVVCPAISVILHIFLDISAQHLDFSLLSCFAPCPNQAQITPSAYANEGRMIFALVY